MKFLTLFSGIEACSVAWKPLGWECVGFSEIEPFPCSLLAHHYPNVPNLGDITKITEKQIADLGDFDVLVFGFPCQEISTAGTRSNLFSEALRIFDYARQHNNCRFAMFENVPAIFSVSKGEVFAAVVREMAGQQNTPIPKYGWGSSGVAVGENGLLEWRVLDAQYFGLAQRRKRVFAILDTGDWFNRPPILFERESLSGYTPPSREKGRGVATTIGTSLTTSDRQALAFQTSHNNVAAKDNITPPILAAQGTTGNNGVYGFDSKQQNASVTEEMTPTLVASGYKEPLGVIRQYVVRRLTPTEWERLMGFPDGYTAIPHNGKPASNSARYKALGNSMATSVMQYIGQQIQNAINFNQPKQDTIPMMTQSPTSLQTFLTCPKQYHAKYIAKEVKFEQNDHATFGDLVHKSIENYLKQNEPLPSILHPLQPTLDKMGQVLFGAETKLAIDKQGKAVDFFDKSAYQRCIVDAILVNADQSVVVCIDWKTGKKRDAQTQHDFIKKCAKAKFPNAKIVTLFLYLFVGEYDRQEYTGQPLTSLDRNMANLASSHANALFQPRPSGLCGKWCDVLSCPYNGKNK